MATWTQRDPRWLVEERPDGANVNGWHWEERNRYAWSKERLDQLLGKGLPAAKVDPNLGHAKITGMKSCTGEAYQTLRKGNKKFSVYDLHVTLDWKGRWHESDKEVTGEVVIQEFCSTNDPDEYVVSVTSQEEGHGPNALRIAIQGLQPAILDRLEKFVAELNAMEC